MMGVAESQRELYRQGVFFQPILFGFSLFVPLSWLFGMYIGTVGLSFWPQAIGVPVFGWISGGLLDWMGRKSGLLPGGDQDR